MGYVNKTISYFKRNGLKDTAMAVFERIDKTGMEKAQRDANAYHGRVDQVQSVCDIEQTICFSLLVPTYETKESFLRELIDSVLEQTYTNLELVIADASQSSKVSDVIKTYSDQRLMYHKLSKNSGISDNTNEALKIARGDYIGLLDHDDVLEKDALYHIAKLIYRDGCDMVYTDEDKMSADGKNFFEPNIKPAFNFDYLLTNNYICHFTVMKASLMKELGFRKQFDGAQDYDLFLRAVLAIEQGENGKFDSAFLRTRIGHISKVLYHWRAHENSTADNPESKRYAYEAGKNALKDLVKNLSWNARVSHAKHLGFYEIEYLPSLFAVRSDVTAIGSYTQKCGRVVEGPMLDGQPLFENMRVSYSGYLHRANLVFEAEHLPEETVIYRSALDKVEDSQKRRERLLYLPKNMYEKERRNGNV